MTRSNFIYIMTAILAATLFLLIEIRALDNQIKVLQDDIYKIEGAINNIKIQQYRTVFETINNYYTNEKGTNK